MDSDSHSPTEPAPPAYDAQEFDRKISAALDMSMDPALQTVDEEEWEEWNDETYKTNATARSPQQSSTPSHPISRQSSKKSSHSAQSSRSQSSSSQSSPYYSSPSVPSWAAAPPPSRRLPSFPPPKERPSWYTEAHLHFPATSDVIRINRSPPPPILHHTAPPVDDEFEDNMDEPLPPFALIGPPLEGPPYSSPYTTRSPSYYTPPPRSPPPPQRRSFNQPSFRQRPVASSPPLSTSSTYSSTPHLPPMPFDPGLAYARQRQVSAFISRDEDSGPVDPSLLYNSAVASVMKKSKSMQPLKKPTTNRDRSTEPNQRQSYDAQSTRSYADSYQGSSHFPQVVQYAVPSLPTQSLQTSQTHSMTQSLPPSLPTLPTLPVDHTIPRQADSRSISSYYMHPNPSQWSQAASSYGYGRA